MKKPILSILVLLAAVVFASGTEVRTFITPPAAGENPYTYLPFAVPSGTNAISVSIAYDKTASRLDFGLFDSRFPGGQREKEGFRGWSGAVRDEFFIAADEASNGYEPGPIPSGTWRLVIGRARVAGDGIELRVTIDLNVKKPSALERLRAERAKEFKTDPAQPFPITVAAGFSWFRGDLHVHTFHGDGSWNVAGALESAASNGLDFVALTEHNTFSHHAEIEVLRQRYPGLLVVRGQEVTTYGGHINVWGLPNKAWVDFRYVPGLERNAIDLAFETAGLGGLASINHPTMNCAGCAWTYGKDWGALDSVEIWNATWDADDEAALRIWDGFLAEGRRITAVGSSDSHQPPYEASPYPTNLRVGEPAVFVGTKILNEKSLFQGIKAGRVIIADSPRRTVRFISGTATVGSVLPRRPASVSIECPGFPPDARIVLISGGRQIANDAVGDKGSLTVQFNPSTQTYIRAEVRSRDGKMLAMTNPIYFK